MKKTITSLIICVVLTGVIFASALLIDYFDRDYLHKLTEEQFLEDYDLFWELVYAEIPFVPVAMKENGVDVEMIIAENRELIEKTPTPENFVDVMARLEKYTQGFGHLNWAGKKLFENYTKGTISYFDLRDFSSRIEFTDEDMSLLQALLPNASSCYYIYDEPINVPENLSYVCDSINVGFIDEEIAYLRLFPNFEKEFNLPRLKEFYNSIADCDHFIIDIRNNSGGWPEVWKEGIVKPLTRKALKYTSVAFYLTGDYTKKYYDIDRIYVPDYEIPEDVKVLPEFEKALKTIGDTPFKTVVSNYYFSLDDELTMYNGKIWLLTNEYCFSMSDTFANFCLSTDFATVVGEPTKGSGVYASDKIFENQIFFSLPNSGMLFWYYPWMGINLDGSSNAVRGDMPDYYTEEDALEYCLQLIEDGKGLDK